MISFDEFNKMVIGIVGLGLLGGSYAKSLKELKPKKIIAMDKNKDVLKFALDSGIIDEYSVEDTKILAQCDLIILAIYPKNILDFITQNKDVFKKGSLIIDIAGIKGNRVSMAQQILGKEIEFLGTHPMAGKESSGFENSDAKIFNNANYILTPTENNSTEAIDFITKMVEAMGCKCIIKVNPIEHDEIIAYTSHLPHIISVALMNSNISNTDIKCFIGGSFKDATRVADINADLWYELIKENSENVIKSIDLFQKNMETFKKAVETDDKEILMNMFSKAKKLRGELKK